MTGQYFKPQHGQIIYTIKMKLWKMRDKYSVMLIPTRHTGLLTLFNAAAAHFALGRKVTVGVNAISCATLFILCLR